MTMTGKQKLYVLMQQINAMGTPLEDACSEGILKELIVHKKSRRWHFIIQLPTPLPFELYDMLDQRIRQAFQNIATIELTIETLEGDVTNETYTSYYLYVLSLIDTLSPPIYKELTTLPLEFEGQKVIRKVSSSFAYEQVKRKYLPLIQELLKQCGLSARPFELIVIENDEQQALQQAAFEQQKMLEDAQSSKLAGEQIAQKELEEKEVDDDGPVRVQYGPDIRPQEPITEIIEIEHEVRDITVQGYVFDVDLREFKDLMIVTVKITDYTDSIVAKMFARQKDQYAVAQAIKKGQWLKIKGFVQHDDYSKDLVLSIKSMMQVSVSGRQDRAPEGKKRIELLAHTKMSQMDSVSSATEIIEQAAAWGHPAVAITDIANVQAFPEAFNAGKRNDIKVLFGMSAFLVDDGVPIAYEPADRSLADETYVVFDVETTGLSSAYDTIIEIAAVRVKNGEIIGKYESFANPHHPLSATTIQLTGIKDSDVKDAPDVKQVMEEFVAFCEDAILVAHNATFDMGFIYASCKRDQVEVPAYSVIDTLELARFLYPDLRNHRLNTLAKRFDIELTQHHRAIYDTEATAYLFIKFLDELLEQGIVNLLQVNDHVGEGDAFKRARPQNCTLLVQNNTGLKNLFKLVSASHIDYFYRTPRIPRSLLAKHREGLLIGTGTDQGEIFETVMQKSVEEAEEKMAFYDYIEIHPKPLYAHLIELELVQDEFNLEDIMRKLVKLSRSVNKPIVATGNVRHLHPTDKIYREVLVRSQGGANMMNRHQLPDAYFRTTDEMLEEFSFLGPEVAEEIVVTNTQQLADQIDEVEVIKKDLYAPNIDGADAEVKELTYSMAHSIYGEDLPEIVTARIEKELKSIIDNGFAVIYLISHKLVKRSLDDGYLVGSRGSVGSSLVATLMEITEVNPLPPHYVCPSCKEAIFFDDGSVSSGFDLKDKNCPTCQVPYKKDGQDIPFETFLGFKGDKVPDIDLNFSGDYQPKAHDYTRVLFGEDYVYRAGTIGTIAEKTAYGYVRGYMNDFNKTYRGAEIDRLVKGCSGVKRSTGQHPGGIIVVPDTMDIYDFTPIQFPANDMEASWKTTHFDFHSIDENLLKLDILGHDDPTMIKMLEDLSGINPKTIPVDDPGVMSLFSSTEALGVSPEQIGSKTGTLGVPEFGTRFVRQMLEETKPSTFSELVQISGLSHGTDVWLGNAQELIKNRTCVLSEVIGCRDDIMVYLIYQGLEPATAFTIMESVRKGKGLTPEFEETMRANQVPEWYIDSCKKIKYMFPKAHAAAYVMMALRIAYFKVHHPLMYYAAYFTVRASDFDLVTMTEGSASLRKQIKEINDKGNEASAKDRSLQTVLEIALEMYERGYSIQKPDLYKADATDFLIEGDSLIPPFNAIPSLGTNVAKQVVEARKDGEFLSKEDLQRRGRVSKTVVEYLSDLGCLEGMPESNQLSIFDL